MIRRTRWDPVTDLVTMQRAMDRLMEDAWAGRDVEWHQGQRVAALPLDVYSTPDELVIKASVPGVEPTDPKGGTTNGQWLPSDTSSFARRSGPRVANTESRSAYPWIESVFWSSILRRMWYW